MRKHSPGHWPVSENYEQYTEEIGAMMRVEFRRFKLENTEFEIQFFTVEAAEGAAQLLYAMADTIRKS